MELRFLFVMIVSPKSREKTVQWIIDELDSDKKRCVKCHKYVNIHKNFNFPISSICSKCIDEIAEEPSV